MGPCIRQQPRVVLFDVDGTLAETERDGHRVAFNRAFEAAGMDDVWDENLYGELLDVGGGRQRLEYWFLRHARRTHSVSSALAGELHAAKTAIFLEMVTSGRIKARPGLRRLVDGLGAARVPIGIVTTGRRAWVAPLVTHLLGSEAYDRLAVVVTGDDVTALKPAPEAYFLALDRLMLAPDRAVAIEDSENGLAAAKAAGMACVVVPSLYNLDAKFRGADLVVPGFDQGSGIGEFAPLMESPPFKKLVFDQ